MAAACPASSLRTPQQSRVASVIFDKINTVRQGRGMMTLALSIYLVPDHHHHHTSHSKEDARCRRRQNKSAGSRQQAAPGQASRPEGGGDLEGDGELVRRAAELANRLFAAAQVAPHLLPAARAP